MDEILKRLRSTAAVPAVMVGFDGYVAVSYTHLDVYKRQQKFRAASAAEAASEV